MLVCTVTSRKLHLVLHFFFRLFANCFLVWGKGIILDSGTIRSWSWSGTFVPRWRLHNHLHMIPSFDGLVLVHGTFEYWVTLNPGLGGVSGSIQLSTVTHEQVQSNRTCNISHCLCSAFSKDPYYTLYCNFSPFLSFSRMKQLIKENSFGAKALF